MAASRLSTSTSAIIARILLLMPFSFRKFAVPSSSPQRDGPSSGRSDLDLPAVDEVLGAGDERTLRPGQEGGQRGDLLGSAHALQRYSRGQRAVEVLRAV